jgi:aldehyde dehydrogenase (NAD+)
MKPRRVKRKMAKRKRSRRSQLVVLDGDGARVDRGVAVAPSERRLTFGERWSYAPAPEASDYIKIRPRYQLFIGGKFVAPRSGKYFDSINPATEEKLAEIAEADAHDVDLAVKSARRAYNNTWS